MVFMEAFVCVGRGPMPTRGPIGFDTSAPNHSIAGSSVRPPTPPMGSVSCDSIMMPSILEGPFSS